MRHGETFQECHNLSYPTFPLLPSPIPKLNVEDASNTTNDTSNGTLHSVSSSVSSSVSNSNQGGLDNDSIVRWNTC